MRKNWQEIRLEEALDYVQPTKFIVKSTAYDDYYKTPVLTPGKSFILGFTDETDGIYQNIPTIIFDDFTTEFKYVDFPFKVKSSAMKMLELKSAEYDIKFLYYLMQTLNFNSTEHKRYWISKYSKQRVNVPTLAEQKQIAAILDAADSLRQKDQQLVEHYTALSQSLFLEMFGESVGMELSFSELADNSKKGTFSNGPFGSDLLTSELMNEGVPVIYIRDISKGSYVRKSDVFVTHQKATELSSCIVEPKDVLITKVGTPPGIAALYPEGEPIGVITQDVIRIRANRKIVMPEFIKHWLNSNLGTRALASIMVQGTRMRFGLGDLKKTKIIVPELKTQEQFAERVTIIEQQKQQAQTNLQKSEALFNSLLQRAFTGELTADKAA